MGMKPAIDECLQLMEKLEKEFPPEPDLEALHAVSGIYATLKKHRDRIDELPVHVRSFCEFIYTARCRNPEGAAFLEFLRNHPGAFVSVKGETFLERRQRTFAIAEQAGLDPARLFHLTGMARLKGILDENNELAGDYAALIADYLGEDAL